MEIYAVFVILLLNKLYSSEYSRIYLPCWVFMQEILKKYKRPIS